MITVYGKELCHQCDVVKERLISNKVNFVYCHLSDLEKDEQLRIKKLVFASGMMSFPIMMRDDVVVGIEEII